MTDWDKSPARQRPTILSLQRVPREDGTYIWKFAGSTVADIPQLYGEFGYGPLEKILPSWFFDYRIWGIEVWLWAAALVVF